MPEYSDTTIAALATAPGPAGIAVVRVSGPATKSILRAVFRAKKKPADHPRELIFGDMIDYKTQVKIDRALAVFMPGPHSFTGEDVCEFQFHGSPILVQKILRSLYAFGASVAQPGEFTRRAFLNGKLDLIQAEAISELITASSEKALAVAGEHLSGALSKLVTDLGEPLRNVLAEIEANIDFPEEEIEPQKRNQIEQILSKLTSKIGAVLATFSYGQVLRDGYRVLLCGRPNAGKSSLLNLLLGRPRAIVSPVSGTTRDLIEESCIIAGQHFVFCDSAGITETSNTVEKIGIELARDRVKWADLLLFVVDASDTSQQWQKVIRELSSSARKIWMVTNKVDLNPQALQQFFCDSRICSRNFYLSALNGNGFDGLTQALVEEVRGSLQNQADSSHIITSERQRNCLEQANTALQRAHSAVSKSLPLEICSADIRQALKSLEELVGQTYTEDILGRIFSKFCIGK